MLKLHGTIHWDIDMEPEWKIKQNLYVYIS